MLDERAWEERAAWAVGGGGSRVEHFQVLRVEPFFSHLPMKGMLTKSLHCKPDGVCRKATPAVQGRPSVQGIIRVCFH